MPLRSSRRLGIEDIRAGSLGVQGREGLARLGSLVHVAEGETALGEATHRNRREK
jgi:hypothetical protein